MNCFIRERRNPNFIVSYWITDLFCLENIKWKGLHTTKLVKALKENPCVCEHYIFWQDVILFPPPPAPMSTSYIVELGKNISFKGSSQ